jgi:hypothetical protein
MKDKTDKRTTEMPLATVPAVNFEEDAGRGMEGTTAESFAIPFLGVLQKGSPQCDEASGAAVEGAKPGMFIQSVSGHMFDGREGLLVVPVAYKRVYVHWGPRQGDGAGFKGEVTPEQIEALRAAKEIVEQDGRLFKPLPDGTVNDKRCERFSDTRNHYVLVIDPKTGVWAPALLSLASTQIKKSRAIMTMLNEIKLRRVSDGSLYTPPTFANLLRLTTVPESNDKGTWYGVKPVIERQLDAANPQDAELYAAARAFHASVARGTVTAAYESEADAAPAAGF